MNRNVRMLGIIFLCFFAGGALPRCDVNRDLDCSSLSGAEENLCPQYNHGICGDNLISYPDGEECDDGNTISGDGCSQACTIEECVSDSDCDDYVPCNGVEKCELGVCIAGSVAPTGTTCDSGHCIGGTCIESTCGDGIVDESIGEQCDDGNVVAGDGCSINCTITNYVTRKIAFVRLRHQDSLWDDETYDTIYNSMNAATFGGLNSLQHLLNFNFGEQILLTGKDNGSTELIDLGILDISTSSNVCGINEAKQQLVDVVSSHDEAGITDVFMVSDPYVPVNCGVSGRAGELSGVDYIFYASRKFSSGLTYMQSTRVIFHEYLHALGAGHSGIANYRDDESLGSYAAVYGDTESVMGSMAISASTEESSLNFIDKYMVGQHIGIDVPSYVFDASELTESIVLDDERTIDGSAALGVLMPFAKSDVIRPRVGNVAEKDSYAISFRQADSSLNDRIYIRRVKNSKHGVFLDTIHIGETFHDTRANVEFHFVEVNQAGQAMIEIRKYAESQPDCAVPNWLPSIESVAATSSASGSISFDLNISHGSLPFDGCDFGLDLGIYLKILDVDGVVHSERFLASPDSNEVSEMSFDVEASGMNWVDKVTYQVFLSRILTLRDGVPFEYLTKASNVLEL